MRIFNKKRIITGILLASALTLAIVTGNSRVYASDKIYQTCSISKVYVTCAVMQLVDKGLVDLDEPLTTYIPEFEMEDERYKDITVRMLLNHTSGLMGTTTGTSFLYDDNDPAAHDELLKYIKQQRLKADPGDFSTYCNDGFDVAELLVEHVTGQDFTEYMTENIVNPINGSQTGTYKNLFMNENLAAVYDSNKHPYAKEYHVGIGTGGVLSTAPEVCKFGSTFFNGNNTLLSEDAKREMATDESKNKYEGHYALGWDDVDVYEGSGVKVMFKGGDLTKYHGALVVAPEEKISAAVLTSGASSTLDLMMAESLINIVLKDRGIDVPEFTIPVSDTVDEVPSEYAEYEGLYTDNQNIYRITFPDMKYMQKEIMDEARSRVEYFKYTKDGGFLRMKGDVPGGAGIVDADVVKVDFDIRDNGRTYLVTENLMEKPRVGIYYFAQYLMEKLNDINVPEPAKQAWKERSGKYYLTDAKYSVTTFDGSLLASDIRVSDTDDAYIYAYGVMRITDENHMKNFVNIPGQGGRDGTSITVEQRDGVDYLVLDGKGMTYINEKAFSEFTSDIKEVSFDKRDVKWYNINENMGGALISIDKTDKTSVYIYDKYDKCIYNTYMTGYGDLIRLPMEGKIMFAGEPGERITIHK